MPKIIRTLSIMALLATSFALAAPAAADTPTPPASNASVMTYFNYYRQMAATVNGSTVTPLGTVTENSSWTSGAAAHVNYMTQTNTAGHSENPSSPYYTSAGDTAAANSVVALYGGSQSAKFMVEKLMSSPFHALQMVDPRLQSTGASVGTSNNRTGAVIDVFRGLSGPAATAPVVWPGPNTDVPVTSYSGTESPNPLGGCPGYGAGAGIPIIVSLPNSPSSTSASLTTMYNGSPVTVPTCSYDQNTYTNASDPANQSQVRSILSTYRAIIIIPQGILGRATTYTAAVNSAGHNLSWSFRTSANPPGMPAINASAGSGKINLQITPPSDNGGAAITGYQVTVNPGNIVNNYAPSTTNVTITGLTNGQHYTVSVTASNSAGTSQANQITVYPQSTPGYWAVSPDGRVDARGTAQWFGDMRGQKMNAPIVAMTATTTGNGYWLLGGDGGIFSFGDAQFYGSTGNLRLNAPVIGMAATKTGKGYWILAKDGGIFSYGDAQFHGSTGSIKLNQPVIDMSVSSSGNGYRLVALDGGIFSFGDAGFYGSMGGQRLNKPVVSMANAPSGDGYWMIGADGGIFAFGPGAPFYGSLVGSGADGQGGVRIRATGDGKGYWILAGTGGVYPFGNAVSVGDVTRGAVDLTLAPGS